MRVLELSLILMQYINKTVECRGAVSPAAIKQKMQLNSSTQTKSINLQQYGGSDGRKRERKRVTAGWCSSVSQ